MTRLEERMDGEPPGKHTKWECAVCGETARNARSILCNGCYETGQGIAERLSQDNEQIGCGNQRRMEQSV